MSHQPEQSLSTLSTQSTTWWLCRHGLWPQDLIFLSLLKHGSPWEEQAGATMAQAGPGAERSQDLLWRI